MQIFYSTDVSGNTARFNHDESMHCIRVLRMRRGDLISFTDGKGNMYEGIIINDDPVSMTASVTSMTSRFGRKSYRLHVAISPLKNSERLEWFIEKAVETGIDEITPLVCNRTERKGIRRKRLEGIIIAAMKQSVQAFLPQLNDPVLFNDFIVKGMPGKKLISCCDPSLDRQAITVAITPGDDTIILIGPEGDFTPEEIRYALAAGFTPVHIGPSRLRTETAGVAACCCAYLANL